MMYPTKCDKCVLRVMESMNPQYYEPAHFQALCWAIIEMVRRGDQPADDTPAVLLND